MQTNAFTFNCESGWKIQSTRSKVFWRLYHRWMSAPLISHTFLDTNCYSRNKCHNHFRENKKSPDCFKASLDLCSSCIQRSRARSMRFRQHLQGNRSDATRSCLCGFPKTCRTLGALGICECSTVKFGTCSFHRKSVWLQCAVDGWFRTIPDSSYIDSAEGCLSRSSRWAGIPCRFQAAPRTELVML